MRLVVIVGIVVVVAVVAVTVGLLVGPLNVADRLAAVFLAIQTTLPIWLTLDQFLLVVAGTSLVVIAALIGLYLGTTTYFGYTFSRRHRSYLAQESSLQRELADSRQRVSQEYDRLMRLSQNLTLRLDKRALLRNLLESSSAITSLPQANSAVALWMFNFEAETMNFELGLHCDETMFSQTAIPLTEQPFKGLITSQRLITAPRCEDAFPFLKPEQLGQLGEAKALIMIPLVIERTVLGILTIFCHPDVLKQVGPQREFFEVAWGEIALALAIAIQGELAILDRLTGAYNQGYFLKRLIQEIDRSDRYRQPVAVLMIDIDNFKAVNDMLGHPQGDAVLKIVSRLIKKEVRAIDLVGRYGGEEFIVMLPETGFSDEPGGSAGAVIVAERIRKGVEGEFRGMQKPLAITVSIGVAVRRHPQDREVAARDLIRLADEQLYRAKTTGKNKSCVLMPESEAPQQVS